MHPQEALDNLRQLANRPTTQINGMAEAQVIAASFEALADALARKPAPAGGGNAKGT